MHGWPDGFLVTSSGVRCPVVGVGALGQPATLARSTRTPTKGLRRPVSDKSRFEPLDQRLLGALAPFLEAMGSNLQRVGDLAERDAVEPRGPDHEGVLVADGTVLYGGHEDEVGMAEREGRHVRQLVCDVAGADRELSPDEAIDAAQAGREQFPDQLRVCRVERVDSLEEAGERLGLDVGAPLGQHVLAWTRQLADARQQ